MEEITDASWNAFLDKVRERGEKEGRNAASWWQQDAIGGRASGDTRDTARRVLKGIEGGDPEVLDGLPHARLSEDEGLTAEDLYDEEAPDGWPALSELEDQRGDEVADAYVTSADDAVQHEVERMCRDVLNPDD